MALSLPARPLQQQQAPAQTQAPAPGQSPSQPAAPPSAGASAPPASPLPPSPFGPPIRFAYGSNAAEIPAKFVANLVFLPVRVNVGQPSLFILDTDAPTSSIDPARAAELGLPVDSSVSPALHNAVLNFPGLDVPLFSLPTTANPDFASNVGRPYQGALGNDLLSRAVVEVDYSRKTVRIYDPATFTYSSKHGVAFPIKFSGSLPLLRAKFQVPGHKKLEAAFNIDTALDASIVFSNRYAAPHKIFSSHFKTIPAPAYDTYPGEAAVLGRATSFAVGKIERGDLVVSFSQGNAGAAADPAVAGSIGGGYLRRFVVTFDFPHKQIFLAPTINFNDVDDTDMSGLSLVARGGNLKTFVVTDIVPHSPAAEAGVQKGDVVAGVDDEPAADMSLQDLRNVFREVGRKCKLLLDRKGKELTVTLTLRRLI
ncbi:MAG: PDZ domain-containing protein [Candidatus Acidiferrales bacterium]